MYNTSPPHCGAVAHLGERFNGIEVAPPAPKGITHSTNNEPISSHENALNGYVKSLHNRALSPNYIETSEKFLRRYLDWLGNTLATLSTESAEKYLSLCNHLKLNTRKRYADYLKAFHKYHGM